MSDNRQQGEQVRREVMGDAFVDRALNNATDFTQPLQEFVNEHAWGGVWTRGVLERKTRSLITLAALTALKCPQELKGHVRGALNNGCTVAEIRENPLKSTTTTTSKMSKSRTKTTTSRHQQQHRQHTAGRGAAHRRCWCRDCHGRPPVNKTPPPPETCHRFGAEVY